MSSTCPNKDKKGNTRINELMKQIAALQEELQDLVKVSQDSIVPEIYFHSLNIYQHIFENATDAILLLNSETGQIMLANRQLSILTGYEESEIVNIDKNKEFVSSFLTPEIKEAYNKALAGEDQTIDIHPTKKDGSKLWLEINFRSIEIMKTKCVLAIARDISSWKTLDLVIKNNEELYRTIYNNAQIGIYRNELNTCRIIKCNQYFAEMFGYKNPEHLIRDFYTPNHYLTTEEHREVVKNVSELTGQFVDMRRMKRLDGSTIWVRISAQKYSDRDYIDGVAIDVTSLKNTQDALADTEDRYRTMLDSMQDLVYIADDNYKILYSNSAMQDRFGESGIDQNCFEFIHNQPKICPWCVSQNVIKNIEASTQEVECLKLNTIFHNSDVPIIHADGQIQRMTIMRDISELRKVQAEQEKFFSLVNDLFCILDKKSIIKTANPAWEKILGFSINELLETKCNSLIHPEDQQISAEFFNKLLTGVGHSTFQNRMKTVDGSYKWLSWNVVYSAEDELYYGVGRDVNDRKIAEDEKIKLQEQLMHVQKLESLGVLAGGIAHDFNNLLTGILGNADLALTEIPEESPASQSIKLVKDAALRSADLAKQMLAYSGKGKFIVQPVNINRVIEQMIELLNISVSKKVTLKLNLAENVPLMIADISQIRQVLMNLIINASEAIDEKPGLITLTTGKIWADRKYLADTYVDDNLPSGCYVFIEVADTGCGIDKENQKRIFEPFYTTKFTGRGLGLGAVMGIIRGHNGAIKIYSEINRGSIFKIVIPCCTETVEEKPTVIKPSVGKWQGKGTILIADDDQVVLNFASRILSNAGFNVIKASDGLEAMGQFTTHQSDICLVLLDYTMPNLNGDEVFARIRNLKKDVKVILSTGYSEEVTNEFIGKGLAGFIQKPYVISSLLDVVRNALEQN